MVQDKLWHDSIGSAFQGLVLALGGPQKVGHQLRPEMDPIAAGRWLNHVLDDERQEKFDLGQILLLLKWGREKDCHTAMYFLTTECGYSEPMIVDPRDERQKLQREFIKSKEELARLLSKMDRLPKVVA